MHVARINDISVEFPFEPYDVQKEYMAKIITSLQTEQNAILESPSGNALKSENFDYILKYSSVILLVIFVS